MQISNKSSQQYDSDTFRRNFGHSGSFKRGDRHGGGCGSCGCGGGRFTNFQCQVSVCLSLSLWSELSTKSLSTLYDPSSQGNVQNNSFGQNKYSQGNSNNSGQVTMDKTVVSNHQIHGIKEQIRTSQCKITRVNSLQVQWLQTPTFSLDLLQPGYQIQVPLFMWQENHRKFSNSVLLKVHTKSTLVMDKVCPLTPLVLLLLSLLLILKCLCP